MKPNCYTCQHRGAVPGDAHSCCRYPGLNTDMLGFLDADNIKIMRMLKIRGAAHGIKSGWFFWPVNFDPVWLENCEGWEEIEKEGEK